VEAELATQDEVQGWFAGRVPKDWFSGAPEIRQDEQEVWVIGPLADVKVDGGSKDAVAAARSGRIKQFREDTRDQRIRIGQEAQQKFGKHIAWGVRIGENEEIFTHLAMPTMTRLRLPERAVLDTLIDAGIARNRAHALAWCVRLVERNQKEWLSELKEAIAKVGQVRNQGPLN
jgi:hypothetical protein